MTREIYRKLIHVSTVAAALLIWALPRPLAVGVLAAGAGTALAVEWLRFRNRWARYHFLRRTRTLLRRHERRRLAGATWMVLAYLLAVLAFPRPVAVAAVLYNGLGDAAAALVGKRWGRRRTSWGKSWEGAAAAFLVCLAVGLLVPGVPRPAAVVGALAAAAIEFLPLPLDDNLRIVAGGGAALWAASLLLL